MNSNEFYTYKHFWKASNLKFFEIRIKLTIFEIFSKFELFWNLNKDNNLWKFLNGKKFNKVTNSTSLVKYNKFYYCKHYEVE